jgi:hypothetical protein
VTALTVVFSVSLAGALTACVVATARRDRRAPALGAAAVLFAVAGVLGILSIGAPLIVAAAVCAWLALRTRPRPTLP